MLFTKGRRVLKWYVKNLEKNVCVRFKIQLIRIKRGKEGKKEERRDGVDEGCGMKVNDIIV
jgi:hypothetical protein